jgi:hypothetical protein
VALHLKLLSGKMQICQGHSLSCHDEGSRWIKERRGEGLHSAYRGQGDGVKVVGEGVWERQL